MSRPFSALIFTACFATVLAADAANQTTEDAGDRPVFVSFTPPSVIGR